VHNKAGEHLDQGNSNRMNNGSIFVYTILQNETTEEGLYTYVIHCNDSKMGGYVSSGFEITKGGKGWGEKEATIYSVLLIVVLVLFILSSIATWNVNGNEYYSIDGQTKVNYSRHLRFFFFFLSHMLLIFVMFFAWQISYNFLHFNFMTELFKYFFYIITVLFPIALFVGTAIFGVIISWDIRKAKELKRGLVPR